MGDATMTFTGTLADINAALDGAEFVGDVNYNGPASVQLAVNDQGNTGLGGPQTANGIVNITIAAVNDAPTIAGPASGSSFSTGLTFSAANGNALTVGDVDAGSAIVQLTLTATDGKMNLGDTSGVTIVSGSANDSTYVVATGRIADLNAALEGLNFVPSSEHSTLQVQVDDLGNSGQGSAYTASKTVAITQAPLIIVTPPAPGVWIPPQGAAPVTPRVSPTPIVGPPQAPPSSAPSEQPLHQTGHHAATAYAANASHNWLVAAGAEGEAPDQFVDWANFFRGDVVPGRPTMLALLGKHTGLLNPNVLWNQMDALAEQIVGPNLVTQLTTGAACLSGVRCRWVMSCGVCVRAR